MASRGLELPYIQMWLIELFKTDPFLIASAIEGRVVEAPADVRDMPVLMLTATPDQEDSLTQNRVRTTSSIVFAIEAIDNGEDFLHLLPVVDRVDVLLARVRHETWVSPALTSDPEATDDEKYQQTLTIYSVVRARQGIDRPRDGDQVFRSLGSEWRIRAELNLSGDVTEVE